MSAFPHPWIRYLVLFLLIGIFVALGRGYVSPVPFGYDEADYMSAARRGFVPNYVDAGVIGIGTFVEKGLAFGFTSQQRSTLSAFIRQSGDISFQRHYHGPLYFYWMILARGLGATNEAALRWASYLLLAVTAALAALLAQELSHAHSGVAGLIAALMTLLGSAGGRTAAQITPHAIYVPAALAALYAMIRWTRQPDNTRLAVLGVALGFALLAIEYAALLVASAVLTLCFLQRRESGAADTNGTWRMLGRLTATALATVFVLWPGGLLKLTLVRNCLVFGYITIVRGGEYGDAGAIHVWAARFADSPLEYLLILFGVGFYLVRLGADRRYWPLVCYVGLVLLTTVRNTSPLPTYISSMLPPLYVLCGVAVEQLLGGRPVVPRLLAVAGLSGLIMAKGFSTVPADRGRERPNAVATLVRYFSARDTDTGRVLVPIAYLPALHYYYPTLRAAPYSEGSDGLAHTARQALDNGYPGLLYASHAREGFGNLLPPERIERIDTIAVAPTIPFYAFYYHLGR